MPKTRYQVLRRKTNVDSIKGMKFGSSNSFVVHDKALAQDIEKEHGMGRGGTGDVLVYPDEVTPRRLEGEYGVHHYTFSVPAKTWKSKPGDDPWVREGNKLVYRPKRG